ncbi:non-ribosomal peptide synthetase [Paenibacillus lutrae]|uniref:Amino acid adenylation domain-containing protein n=1 Tax=Paenibacillus lutrae TaxID=2078573 RepID=A0A7X3JY36_9BACL|nr:non-ribosomal peptide synthetase [Paenibacillus lutrae]MVO98626.1 amino acid adenylation domain-containing protein [Paenibacillus lutrae]
MNRVYQFVFENVLAEKLDRNLGAQIISLLNQESRKEKDDIAIIGMSVRMPAARNVGQFWENLKSGKDCVGEFPVSRKEELEAVLPWMQDDSGSVSFKKGSYLDKIAEFDAAFFRIPPAEAALMDPNQREFLQAAWHALEDAGYIENSVGGKNIGIYLGYSSDFGLEYKSIIRQAQPSAVGVSVPGNLKSIIASRLAYILDLKGPSMLIDTACSSSLVAFHTACQALRENQCEMALAGGVKINFLPLDDTGGIGIESTDGKAKSFDDSSKGTIFGEGVAALVLKPLSAAQRDGDQILAVVKGSAINQDGASIGITAPNAAAQQEVMMKAWKQAEIDPESISYIEAHGTGTVLGDSLELSGIENAFRSSTNKKQFCAIGSVKSNIGHLDHVAGLAGIVKAVLALQHRYIPPTLHIRQPNRKFRFEQSAVYVNDKLLPWDSQGAPRRCGISSFGLSGTNCHVVLEEAPPAKEDAAVSSPEFSGIFTVTAKNEKALLTLLAEYDQVLSLSGGVSLENICYMSNIGRGHYKYRAAMLADTVGTLQEKVVNLLHRGLRSEPEEGIYYGIVQSDWPRPPLLPEKLTLEEMCAQYIAGADVLWERMHSGLKQKVRLPLYPFAATRYWVEMDKGMSRSPGRESGPSLLQSAAEPASVYHRMVWEASPEELQAAQPVEGCTIVLHDGNELAEAFLQELPTSGDVVEVRWGEGYEAAGGSTYTVSGSEADYVSLFETLRDRRIGRIVHLLTLGESGMESSADLRLNQAKGTSSLFHLVRAMSRASVRDPLECVIVTLCAYEMTGEEQVLSPGSASLIALAKVVEQEASNVSCRCIDMDERTPLSALLNELAAAADYPVVGYRDGVRYRQQFRELDLGAAAQEPMPIRSSGIYVITGGTGGIGLEIARYLAQQNRVQLCLIHRSEMPDKPLWDEWVSGHADTQTAARIRSIREIEAAGSGVTCYRADVADEEALARVLDQIRSEHGAIHGIVHSAGTAGDGMMVLKKPAAFSGVIGPKIYGTWHLDHLTRGDHLDFFVMFSSVTALTGGLGQGDYTAANAYLDAYASYRAQRAGKTVTISWPAWKETGMAVRYGVHNQRSILQPVATAEAMGMFAEIMNRNVRHVIAGKLDHAEEQKAEPGIRTKRLDFKGKSDGSYTETELLVGQIWGEVAGFDEIHIGETLYEQGIDSILAIRIANRLQDEWNIPVTIGDLFEHLSVSGLSGFIDQTFTNPKGACTAVPHEDNQVSREPEAAGSYPLSSAQRRIWFLQKMNPQMTAYNLPSQIFINRPIQREGLNKALSILIQKHEALRTVFTEENGEPRQIILPHLNYEAEFHDLTNEAADPDEQLQSWIAALKKHPFDLSQRLLNVVLFKLADEEYCLFLNIHHVITDGWSMDLFFKQLLEVYDGHLSGQPVSIAWPEARYVDCVQREQEWLDGHECRMMSEYWRQELAGPLPVLELPADFSRPAVQTFNGNYIKFRIDAAIAAALKERSRSLQATMHMTLLSAYFLLLHKLTSQDQIIVGIPMTGRENKLQENIFGLFINTLCVRIDFERLSTFDDLVAEVRDKSLLAYRNGKFPFEALVSELNPARDLSRNPIFNTMYQYYDVAFPDNDGSSQYDLSFLAIHVGDEIEVKLEYNSDLFKEETIRRISQRFLWMLEQAAGQGTQEIQEIRLLTSLQEDKLLEQFSAEDPDCVSHLPIHTRFEMQVGRTPDAIAIRSGDLELTYQQLNMKSNRLAERLREEGVEWGDPVGVLLDRGAHAIIAIIGILKAGGAYVPLDPNYPAERVLYVISHCGARVLITEEGLAETFAAPGEPHSSLQRILLMNESSDPHKNSRYRYLNPDETGQAVQEEGAQISPDQLMYIMYTSGSTGQPKGVMVTHRNAANYLLWSIKELEIKSQDRMLLVSSISFDISVFEIFGALLSGASLHLATNEMLLDVHQLYPFLERHNITIWHSVPALMSQLLLNRAQSQHDLSGFFKGTRVVMLGGEAWSTKLYHEVRDAFGKARIMNMYGPTEATIWVTSYTVEEEHALSEGIPIGRPVANNRMLILDRYGRLCDIGIEGDLYVSGMSVTKGYMKDEERTRQAFIASAGKDTMYRTGDRAKYSADGFIQYMGRADNMLKVRGYRIEPGEIENLLLSLDEIQEAAAVVQTWNETQRLVCYYVSPQEIRHEELRARLRSKLPDYMIPALFIGMNQLPLTANGKVDRKTLSSLDITDRLALETPYVEPATTAEQFLAQAWTQVLGIEEIGINDSFFELGGSSLLVNQLHSLIENRYPGKVTIIDLFKNHTIAAMAAYLDASGNPPPKSESAAANNEADTAIAGLIEGMERGSLNLQDILDSLDEMEVEDE